MCRRSNSINFGFHRYSEDMSFGIFQKSKVSLIFGFKNVTDVSGDTRPRDTEETGVEKDKKGT